MSNKITTKKMLNGERSYADGKPWVADTTKTYDENLQSLKKFWKAQNGCMPEGVALWRIENHLQKNYVFKDSPKKRARPNMLCEYGKK